MTAFLDADDTLTPNSIGARIDAVCRNFAVKWCGGDFVRFFPDRNYTEAPVYRSGVKKSPAFDGYRFDRPLLIHKPVNYFFFEFLTSVGAVLISTDVLKKLKGFREDLFQPEDYNIFLRLAIEYDFLFIPDVVFIKREHGKGISKRKKAPRIWTIKNFKSLLKDLNFRPHFNLIKKS